MGFLQYLTLHDYTQYTPAPHRRKTRQINRSLILSLTIETVENLVTVKAGTKRAYFRDTGLEVKDIAFR